MSKLIDCGGCYLQVGKLSRLEEAKLYRSLANGPVAWFGRDGILRKAGQGEASPTDAPATAEEPEAESGEKS